MSDRVHLTDRERERFRVMACACQGISDEALRALASRGGLAALIEAARAALSLLEADRKDLFESYVNRRTGQVEDADEKAEIASYDAAIEALRALLPQTGEGEAGGASEIDVFLSDVQAEFYRGRAKFPGNELKTVALSEEFGELVKAVLDETAADVRKEAVQVAAMCLRLVMDGDSSVDGWRERNGLDALSKREDG